MDYHTFPAENADRLEDAAHRYRFCSAEELLGGIGPDPDDIVVDLGSGTGFYTRDVAPHVGTVHAVDVQDAMHDQFRERGVPENVRLVTAGADSLPLAAGAADAVFTTMTFHELPRAVVAEAARVLAPGGRFVVVDWSADGTGDDGPPVEERVTAGTATEALREAEFAVEFAATRTETFFVVGEVDGDAT
jgi:ubiquinone/menaquinone biosynthesis C-methylase UbiE